MNVQHFYTLLENTASEQTQFSEIKTICEDYPYFTHAQMLYLSHLYHTHDDSFTPTLKKFAHTIPDRKFFFQKIHAFPSTLTKKETAPPKEAASLSNQPDEKPTTEHTLENPQTISSPPLKEQIEKEINKTIAESIVQKEIFEIEPPVKTKIAQITSTTSTNEDVLHTAKEDASENLNTLDTEETSTPLPSNSLSHLLQQYSKSSTDTNQTLSPTPAVTKQEKIKQQQEIIDKILSNPVKTSKITPSQKFFSAENKAKESLLETEDLVTETLAQIYASQGNIHKAIRAYEILSLKFPQKNTYFAAKIEELKKQLKK